MPTKQPESPANSPQPKSRLWNRSFSMVVVGQIASLFANNILHFAVSLYLLFETGSPALFASITALSMVPIVLLMPFGGALADRVNRQRLMVAFDMLCGAATLVFGILLPGAAGGLTLVAVFLMLLSVIEALYTPVVQACIPTLQSGDNLLRANAIVSEIGMGSNILGPVLGGILYGLFGIMPLIWVSGVFFLLSALMECFIRLPHTPAPSHGGILRSFGRDMADGGRFVKKHGGLVRVIAAAAALNFLMASLFSVGLPYFITILLGLPEQLYGFATGAVAAGGIVGAALAALGAKHFGGQKQHRLLLIGGLLFLPIAAGFALGLAPVPMYVVLVVCCFGVQLLGTLFSIVIISTVQGATPATMVGKVMAIINSACICAEPLGRVVFGFAYEAMPGQLALVVAATALLAVVVALWTRKAFSTGLLAGEKADEAAKISKNPA